MAEPERHADERQRALVRGQPVGAHQGDGLGLDQPHAIHRAAAQHGPGELQIVVGCGDQPAAAAFVRGGGVGVRERDVLQRPALGRRLIEPRHPAALLRRLPEGGVAHAQRAEDSRLQRLTQGLAVDPRQQKAQHFGGVAVVHPLARLIAERQLAQRRQPGVGGHRIDQRRAQRVLVGIGDRSHRGEAIGQAGPVGQQVLDGDVAVGRNRLVHRPAGVFQHDHIGEFRHPAGDRIVQLQLAFLDQHHDRHRGHRLGHRGDAEQGVALHRRLGGDIAPADDIDVHHLAAAPHQRDRAGEQVVVDHPLDRRRDLRQRGSVECGRSLSAVHDVSRPDRCFCRP